MDTFKAWLSFLDLSWATQIIEGGGPVVVILLVISVVCLTTVMAKALQFIWLGVGNATGHLHGLAAWIRGRPSEAIDTLNLQRSPTSRVVSHAIRGLVDGQPEHVVREDSERLANEALSSLRSRLRIIELTAQVAPLLGLFGTVIGMMSAFQALQSAGSDADPAALAGGIWLALITTAVGLAVAMPAAAASYWFDGRLDREKSNLENALTAVFTKRLQGQVGRTSVQPDTALQSDTAANTTLNTGPYTVWSAPDAAS
ncbi:MAG: MotA/TolQ/ExbB proton channel family protein [Pseudomonadota bacterium]